MRPSRSTYRSSLYALLLSFSLTFFVDFISHATGNPLGNLYIAELYLDPEAISTWSIIAFSSAVLIAGLVNFVVMIRLFKIHRSWKRLPFYAIVTIAFMMPIGLVCGVVLLFPNLIYFAIKVIINR